jgi:hypothetical protein
MSNPLPWEEQAISDPNSLRAFIKLCDQVTAEAPCATAHYRSASIDETVEAMALALEKNPNDVMWYVVGSEGDRGAHLFAFCGNGPNSESKAYFIQLALKLLPVLLRHQLGWVETIDELEVGGVDGVDAIYQLRNTES